MSLKNFKYTICPVGNSSYIAANKIWKRDTFEKAGGQPILLQTLPKEAWGVHFNYKDDSLFREGGNIPPLWAKSNGAEVVLLGLAFLPHKSYIIVKNDSTVDYVEQLRNKKVGIPVASYMEIDFYKATVEHAFETAFGARGLSNREVEFVPLEVSEAFLAMTDKHKSNLGRIDLEALDQGLVEGAFVSGVLAPRILGSGNYKVIYELEKDTSQVLPINNIYPNVLTVSKRLADENPEIVVEYIKQTLLAAEWAKTNRAETLQLFSDQLHGTVGEVSNILPADFNQHLAVDLSEKGLLALEGQLRFLYDHHYVNNIFDIGKWADSSFLIQAFKELR